MKLEELLKEMGHAYGNGLKVCLEILEMYVCRVIRAAVKIESVLYQLR